MSIDRRSLFAAGAGAAVAALAGRASAQPEGPADTGPAYLPPQNSYPPSYPQSSYPQNAPQGDASSGGYQQGGYRQAPPPPRYDDQRYDDGGPPGPRAETYEENEIVHNVSNFFGVASENVAGAVEHVFRDNGRPTGYIAGTEGSAAFIGGLRYGKGLLYMKHRRPFEVYWQGPSVGFDFGGNASRVFTLCYNLQYPDAVFQRFPGVDGSLYVVAGIGVNYQKANDIVLAPIRTGVGLRGGANVGYLAYSRQRHILPF